jgi:hypothetical protein
MILSRKKMEAALRKWHKAWADHDLDGVMELFHEESFRKLDRREGRRRMAGHGPLVYPSLRIPFYRGRPLSMSQQKVHRWQLEWLSIEKGCEGRPEKRRGVDVMHFKDGKIIRKLTYSKTTLEIDGQRVRLLPERLR